LQNNNNIQGGAKRKQTKKYYIPEFTFDDLVEADEEVFINSKSINPFIKHDITEDEEGRPQTDEETDVTPQDELDDKLDEITDMDEAINDIDDEDEIEINNIDEFDDDSEDSDIEIDNKSYFDTEYMNNFNSVIKGGKNISKIKEDLENNHDIKEYTNNIKGSNLLTGGNMKPIKRQNNKLYPYNLF
jgi:hypothetical protein